MNVRAPSPGLRPPSPRCAGRGQGRGDASARFLQVVIALGFVVRSLSAQPLHLPTANRALFETRGEEKFFVGTVGKPWTTGTFGCVRSDGWQLHEGLDIRCRERDKAGEPADSVTATAEGVVAYLNARPSLSNYGNYIILRHRLDGVEIFSLYAHLREILPGIKTGQGIKAGQPIAVMGRTSNTRQRISKDRAHVHFELDLLISDRFSAWFKQTFPNERNDHGEWNGRNLAGLDPRLILLAQQESGARFNLPEFVRGQTELCRVLVLQTDFPWLRRYPPFIRRNPAAEKVGVAGYEIALNYNGLPFQLTPRAATEFKGKNKFQLLSVNEAEQQKNPCRRLVTKKGGRWQLTGHGLELLELLTY